MYIYIYTYPYIYIHIHIYIYIYIIFNHIQPYSIIYQSYINISLYPVDLMQPGIGTLLSEQLAEFQKPVICRPVKCRVSKLGNRSNPPNI